MSAASHLRAMARAIRAEAELHAQRASALDQLADKIERGGDAWLSLDEAASIAKCKPRVITDDEKRGRITLGRAGRRPVVSRSELDRWIASRAATPTIAKAANDSTDDDRAAARASIARAADRVGR